MLSGEARSFDTEQVRPSSLDQYIERQASILSFYIKAPAFQNLSQGAVFSDL